MLLSACFPSLSFLLFCPFFFLIEQFIIIMTATPTPTVEHVVLVSEGGGVALVVKEMVAHQSNQAVQRSACLALAATIVNEGRKQGRETERQRDKQRERER